ncbi:putative polysaccharide biosynthesis protein [Vibrio coralliirubri]|nr:putative polysaccharide biosynthesis protein [Vibrio coralliirubri]
MVYFQFKILVSMKKIIENKYFKNSTWLILDKILRMLVGFFISVLIVRHLGPSDFGYYSYIIGVVYILYSLAGLGLNDVIVRYLLCGKYPSLNIIIISFVSRLVFSCLIFFFYIIYRYITQSNQGYSELLLIAMIVVPMQSFNVADSFFQSIVKSKYTVVATLFSFVIVSALRLYGLENDYPLQYFVYLYVLEYVGSAVFLTLFFSLKFKNKKISERSNNKLLTFNLLKDATPLLLSGFVVSLFLKLDQVMIMKILGEKELGIYSVAVRISELWYFLPIAVITSLFPSFIKSSQESHLSLIKVIEKTTSWLVFLAFIVASIVTIFGGLIIDVLYGKEYLPSSEVLSVHIWTSIFIFANIVFSKYFIIINKEKIKFILDFIALLINIISNILLIPYFGILGAAIATLICYPLSYIVLSILFDEVRCTLKIFCKTFSLNFKVN